MRKSCQMKQQQQSRQSQELQLQEAHQTPAAEGGGGRAKGNKWRHTHTLTHTVKHTHTHIQTHMHKIANKLKRKRKELYMFAGRTATPAATATEAWSSHSRAATVQWRPLHTNYSWFLGEGRRRKGFLERREIQKKISNSGWTFKENILQKVEDFNMKYFWKLFFVNIWYIFCHF